MRPAARQGLPAASPAAVPYRAAEALLDALHAEGVELIFGYPGGAIMPVYDALVGHPIRHILVRHEQAAALAADGYARFTGKLGVCMATSGPGATNLITGLADAFLDSVPLLAITGQVARPLMGTDAFQEVDTFGITLPVVKHSFLVRDPEAVPVIVHEACLIARSGRPGPVLIDLPKDVASSPVRAGPGAPLPDPPAPKPNPCALERARHLLARAERPVLYSGYGVALAGAEQALRELVEAIGIPVVSTLKGLGGLPTDHPAFLGMLGMHGSRAANRAVQEADLLLCVGARFDDRATGRLDDFAPRARVIHLDADPGEISKLRYAEVALCGDLRVLLPALALRPVPPTWRRRVSALKEADRPRYDAPGRFVYAPALIRRLYHLMPEDAVVTCDVGQHQMWVAQHGLHRSIRQHLTSGGLGTMGFGLPAAIGVKLADPQRTVVCITGDGSFMMNLQELATLRRYRLAVKILLLDNASLGMVRQWQELFHAHRYSEIDLSDNPDFAALARVFGLWGERLDSREALDQALGEWLSADGPALLHVPIDPMANVWPLVPPNRPNHEQLTES